MTETAERAPGLETLAAMAAAPGLLHDRRFRDLLEALPAAVYTTDPEGRITYYNQAAVQFWGRAPEPGEHWCGSWKLFTSDGRPLAHEQCPMAVCLKEQRPVRGAEAVAERPDGIRVPFIPFPTPLRDESGAVTGAVNMLVDITAQKDAAERQKRLADELNHRVKNTLATVQSLAAATLRHAGSPEAFGPAFEARLVALGKAHDLLTETGWEAADLDEVLRRELAPFGGRVRLAGPRLRLTPRQALALAMVAHELATNAAKYGALSVGGFITVVWERENGRATLVWSERGGPPAAPPERRSFGSRMIERSVKCDLDGEVTVDYARAGLACTVSWPLG